MHYTVIHYSPLETKNPIYRIIKDASRPYPGPPGSSGLSLDPIPAYQDPLRCPQTLSRPIRILWGVPRPYPGTPGSSGVPPHPIPAHDIWYMSLHTYALSGVTYTLV